MSIGENKVPDAGKIMTRRCGEMDEYIKRDDAKNSVHRHWLDSSRTLEEIMDIPAADVVPVVRCRECKHYRENITKKYGNLICRCTRMGNYDMDYPVRPDDFCSRGERK